MAFEGKPKDEGDEFGSDKGEEEGDDDAESNPTEKSAQFTTLDHGKAKKSIVSKKSLRKTAKGCKACLAKVYVFIKKFIFDICFLLFMFTQEIDDTSFLK